jgi:hypothetical protein
LTDTLRELISTTAKSVQYLRPLVLLGQGDRRVTVATLNYDRSIELAAADVQVGLSTGIEDWIAKGVWRWPERGVRLLKTARVHRLALAHRTAPWPPSEAGC